MKTIAPLALLALAATAGAVGLAGSAQADTPPGTPSGPAPTDVCAQQLAAAPVVGQWTGTLHSACGDAAGVNNLAHHPLG
ncbi:hypothetical protein [Streptacidiphilus jiangxiensis]|uniref:Uncharacterized protein n=1 Tax=Streptacidiphilus jiangxiensis TaxID=235985 RepID=A0A1H7QN76_STRJI|nr:hypothetical protein [Streptacidiphilus jiangxiensis]SEL49065.1 hypothetical protein SAMN05414137_109107 [Streptacidiphilus jiangxiensis]